MIHIEFDVSYATLRTAGTVTLIVLLALLLVIRVRRRRVQARADALLRGISRDFVPLGSDAGIEAFRREVDASHQAYERRMAEDEWQRDGCILLERRKPLPEAP